MAKTRISIRLAGVGVAVALVTAGVVSTAGAAPRVETATAVKGTLALGLGSLQQVCRATRAGTAAKPLARFSCGASGVYTGQPARAGANYFWSWVLPIGKDGKTKATGPETGRIGLNFGGGAIVYLTTKGMETPRGTTAARTTGTWTVKSGTGRYAGATGKGTYVFDTAIATDRFSVLKLTLSGAIS